MEKDVLVTITGMQSEYADMEGTEHEAVEVVNPATYFFKDGSHYIFFEEVYEDTTNVTKNKIIFRENESLEVVKKGATNSTMKFHCDEYHESIYETPYGEMLLGVTTRTIESEVADSQITIKAYYELSVNCESYADCEISMKISNKNLGI